MPDKNRRSLSPILRCAFGMVNENPPVFAEAGGDIAYRRAPLTSQREADAQLGGTPLAPTPVEVVTWSDKEVEAADLARRIQKTKKEQRCSWSDFAVLYRQHSHREELVREFTELQGVVGGLYARAQGGVLPQEAVAFGLTTRNEAPIRSSTKSTARRPPPLNS